MSKNTQFFCRQPKSIDLIQDFEDIAAFQKPSGECRSALYSGNGKYFAYTQSQNVVVVDTTLEARVVAEISLSDAYDLHFSSKGSYLCIWCKPILENKESGVWNKNVKLVSAITGKIIAEWSEKHQAGWKPQFTSDEKIFAKNVNNKEIFFFDVSSKQDTINLNQPSYRFKLSDPKATFQTFQISPGLNPSVAIFIPEKGGKPASVVIYNVPNFSQPICQKNFFKAERCQLKWNSLGTALLALASTDHDTTNKSYYGETNLYLLGIAGSYDSRIDLKRTGPIHDITWSPTAREFAVIYGYMPAETTFFDARGNSIYSLPTAPRNTILYSPHSRFVLVAGFGNLQGTVDIYDRQNKFSKITSFEASNTSVCEWSPCGRFILTATTSPRLRVDNGCKVWHASGKLIYMKEYPELYSIAWKPQEISSFPPLRTLEPPPEAHISTREYVIKKQAQEMNAAKKPSGAYRPPHARTTGVTARTSLFQKEMQSSLNENPSSGSITSRTKAVPGAAPVQQKETKSAAKNRKKREAKKSSKDSSEPPSSKEPSPQIAQETAPQATTGGTVLGGVASLEEKKIRSLLKKLRAIETLKMKQASGDHLEDTQVSKIKKEEDIRKELLQLGWNE